ncbi:TPA: hypothetical protein QDC43_004615 [Burkholderia aenigmatica]|nr:hypothetical protein [Burkholderia aenigmatica]HDR9693907.1 hypothetical protein [Burkholderia aenigmatica]
MRRPLLAICAIATFKPHAGVASSAPDVSIRHTDYGTIVAGQPVSRFTLANQHGAMLKVHHVQRHRDRARCAEANG